MFDSSADYFPYDFLFSVCFEKIREYALNRSPFAVFIHFKNYLIIFGLYKTVYQPQFSKDQGIISRLFVLTNQQLNPKHINSVK